MHVVTMILMLLLAVVVSTFIVKLLPLKVPIPLVQIVLGAALSMLGMPVSFDSHLFLLLFIPPLLFLDGWRIPKGALFGEWRPILSLAIGLVVFTVVGMGMLIHWLIPAVSLAVAFALAAILSPTDPVAVSAMTANSPLPSRIGHILEGESLLNDATGLVCFSFAVTAALTGTFSLGKASLSFVMVAGGGIIIGLALVWVVGRLNRLLVNFTGEDPAVQILISLLIPFAAYLAAEHVHVSGILAAAVAGIAMHYNELSGRTLASTRMQRTVVWDTVQTALNGIIFLLLGEQLPSMLRAMPDVAAQAGAASVGELVGYVFLITLALGLLRFGWVWISLSLLAFRRRLAGGKRGLPHWRVMAVISTAGVRGAITLAGILTLPLLMPDGSAFPSRDLAIFIAMGVIILSLVIASIALPLLTRGLHMDLPRAGAMNQENLARVATAEAAVRRLEALASQPLEDPHREALRSEAVTHIMDIYRRRLDYGDASGEHADDMHRLFEMERVLRIEALRAERDILFKLRTSSSIDDDVHRRLLHEIDLKEGSLTPAYKH